MVKVIAHRGARSLAPENTRTAAQQAYDIGADLWETDVNITRDNRLILFHDQTLDRCTDVAVRFPGRSNTAVASFDLDEIHSLDSGSYFIRTDPFSQIKEGNIASEILESFKNEKVLSLIQGLELVKQLGWIVNLELKSFDFQTVDFNIPDRTLAEIRQSRIEPEQVIISSFNHDWLKHIRKTAPYIEIAALAGESDTEPIDFGDYSFGTYNVNARTITPEQIKKLKNLGKVVNVFTVNDSVMFTKFERMGVDGIFTDFPQKFVKS